MSSEDEIMKDYDGDSEGTPGKGKGKEEMPKRGGDSSSGEVLWYFDAEPDFFS